MIGIKTVLKTLALICLVNLTFIKAEEAAATVENKVDTPVEGESEGNLRFMAGCLNKGAPCSFASICCSKRCTPQQTCF